jgi:transcriptional regulator with PAS, ATPase and Fis domain
MKKIMNQTENTVLREAAEKILKRRPSKTSEKLSETDSLKLIHELEVYQVELEMQNDELINARDEVRTANEKFTALYDFAHTGYFTIDRKGKIGMLNLSGATMLGKERSAISNKNFRQFVTIDTLPQFNEFILKVFETHVKENCHVRLITKGNQSIFAKIEGIVSMDEDRCKLIAVDETIQKRTEELMKFKAHELELFDEFMMVKNHQMIVLKKEINHLLKELGQNEKYKIDE